MVEAVIRSLIAICFAVLCVVLILWVLGTIGLMIPQNVVHIIFVILALICILIIYRMLKPVAGGWLP